MTYSRRMSRRGFLKLSGAVAAFAIVDVSRWHIPTLAQPATRSEWTFSDGLPSSGTFETPVLEPETRFDSVDISWLAADRDGTDISFELRTRSKDGTWTEWTLLHPDDHRGNDSDLRGYIAPVLRSGHAVQVRVSYPEAAELQRFTVGVLDTSSGGTAQAQATPTLIDGLIIPRAGWGADESLRYKDKDPKKGELWPPSYQQIEKVIVHHTVTDNDPPDPAAAIRSIYYYHAINRGWGDIGYNYLIDWDGRVYEGRYGGPDVIGGHALRYNAGSMGVALLGDFTKVAPPNVSVSSLVKLIELRAPAVDVSGAADFEDLIACPNLCGHADVLSTTCPGDLYYAMLPEIRGQVAGTAPVFLPRPARREWLELLEATVGPSTVPSGNLLEVRLRVRNSGLTTLNTGGPDPGFVYREGQDFSAAGFPKVEGEYRFGLDFASNTGAPKPYRWGFGSPIAPGEEREVVGYVRVKTIGVDTFTVSIVNEFVEYVYENEYPTRIGISPPPVAPVPQTRDPNTRFFSETGHNVPGPFARYWDQYGGLRRFGYPLTEAFEEVSETDGKRYLTQYFERARFEYHPEYAGTVDEVLLGLLGAELMALRRGEQPFQPVEPFETNEAWIYFPETGHSLGGKFRRVWEENGGLRIFGYPLSQEFFEVSETDGNVYTVQYFERNRFELHLDYAGTPDEVMLGHLGREVLIRRGWM